MAFSLFFLKIYFWRFCLLFDRKVVRQETKLEREREGRRDRERSGRPKCNCATCRRAAHEAIGADSLCFTHMKLLVIGNQVGLLSKTLK